MNVFLSLSAADYTALAGALVLVIGAVGTAAVQIINAIRGHDAAAQARSDNVIAHIDTKS